MPSQSTPIAEHFSSTYSEAREKFLKACSDREMNVESRLNPNAKGVAGEDLYMDVARLGSANATRVLFLMSGTHGVEGYCGSGVQVGLLNEGEFSPLPDDMSVVFIHAMNPYGFSHNRRVTEDNIDLNRNFLDFTQAPLPQGDYTKIHDFILPEDWDGDGRRRANKHLAQFIEANGVRAFQAAVSGGQYQHPDGVFFGGHAPTWSNLEFRSVLRDYAREAELVAFIDFHTGLGPYGYGELISLGSPEQKERVRAWFGDDVTDPDAGTSSSAPVVGTVGHGVAEELSNAAVAFIALEYGTRDLTKVLTALRGDNWLYHKGDIHSTLGHAIKTEIRDAFYPDQDDWKQMVWDRAREITQLALGGLRAGV